MADAKILVQLDGPYRVYGPVELTDADGKPFTVPNREWVSLCRCGNSNTKPFCDGAHKTSGFDAPTRAT
jgi:CDGSH-type Zn-finger protein